jgi:uncharacterized repeat protein (TIGR03803 family)
MARRAPEAIPITTALSTVDIAGGTETVLHRFTGTDGSTSVSKLANRRGKLYGATAYGGADDNGVVFSLSSK